MFNESVGLRDSEVEPDNGSGDVSRCWCDECSRSGVIVPAAVGGTTAAVASALTAGSQAKGEPIAVTADTVVNKAPDNFFTLLGKLVGMGGWLLGLVILLPMILGWIIPGPLKMHKRKKKR